MAVLLGLYIYLVYLQLSVSVPFTGPQLLILKRTPCKAHIQVFLSAARTLFSGIHSNRIWWGYWISFNRCRSVEGLTDGLGEMKHANTSFSGVGFEKDHRCGCNRRFFRCIKFLPVLICRAGRKTVLVCGLSSGSLGETISLKQIPHVCSNESLLTEL